MRTKKNDIVKAVRYIYQNIDLSITIEDVAAECEISVSTLKRLFIECLSKSFGAFIRRIRMERAFRSLKDKETRVLEVALSVGFEDHSAFARAFKKTFGYSPTLAREKLNIVSKFECISLREPEIVEVNEIRLESITQVGLHYDAAPKAWKSLKEHLTQEELEDDYPGIFIGIGYDNPHNSEVQDNMVRFTSGVSLHSRELNIEHTIISKGTYARFSYIGKPNNLGLAYHYIYGVWNEKSKNKINTEIPAFMIFDSFPDRVGEQNISIYAPLSE